MPTNGISTSADWRNASRASRETRAEPLTLPSGATILAARPEPLEWILAGRVPQRLLAAALGESQARLRETEPGHPRESGDPALDSRFRGNDSLRGNDGVKAGAEMTREDVLELARFAAQLVRASVVRPAIGEGPGEISLDEIPVEDRAFIFEWACRALGSAPNAAKSARSTGVSPVVDNDGRATCGAEEALSGPSVDGLERFCAR